MNARTSRGTPYPQGATVVASGVNFALYSESATAVSVCLFDERGAETTIPLTHRTGFVWHGLVHGVRPGQRYGFRVDGPWDLARGHRHNPKKLLADPYARAFDGKVSYRGGAVFGHTESGAPDPVDSAPFAPKSVVVDEAFEWGDDAPPQVPWEDTVIYEAHVKGLTKLHPDVPPELRGTYAGLGSEACVAHLRRLGVTTVELLPVHEVSDEPFLVKRGLTNYWGYSTLGFFAPISASPRGRASRSASSEPWSRRSTPRHRGHPRRRLQPHLRGRRPRADALPARHRQPHLLQARRRRRALRELHRLRQHGERRAPAGAEARLRQPALLGRGDARRRLPLRSRHHARPRRRGFFAARGVLPRDEPGSRPLGVKLIRSLGLRARLDAARALPAGGGSGTPAFATASVASGTGTGARWGTSATASRARAISSTARGGRPPPASTS